MPGPTYKDSFVNGIWKENPVFVQVLGMCPTLAITNSVENAIAMSCAVMFVLVMSNALVSLMRNWVPKEVRIAVFILIIATFVTVTDYAVRAISVSIYKAMGPFIALIVVNCIILSRAEAFSSKNGVLKSILDGIGMGIGFAIALLCMGSVREILGSGSFLGHPAVRRKLPALGHLRAPQRRLLHPWRPGSSSSPGGANAAHATKNQEGHQA